MDVARFENLEIRRLFAGLTLIAPTWDSGVGGYVAATNTDMINRLGGGAHVPEYRLVIGPNKDGTLAVQGLEHYANTAKLNASGDQQVVLTLDYTAVSQDPKYPLSVVAGVVTSFLENTPVDGVRLAELPIHEIGVSRSSVLMDEISRSLGLAGIWVDQETYNDPHPVYEIGDPPNTLYDNVAFVDNYWRTSGQPEYSIFYNGTSVNGAYNLELPFVQADTAGFGSPHQAPATYYDATIDLNATTGIIGPVHDDWFGNTPDQPARSQTGFYYSAIVGGTRPSSGVWSFSGGSGSRIYASELGQQWPNVTEVTPTAGTTFASGKSINISYLHEDRDDNSTVTFYLDTDQNPYLGRFAKTLGSVAVGSSMSPVSDTFTGSTRGVAAGTYYLVAVVDDTQGHRRVSYSTNPITITGGSGVSATPAPPITSRAAQPPVSLIDPAQAAAPTVTTTSTMLSVLGGGTIGENNLNYNWTILAKPTGAADPAFSSNGNNGSKNTTVTFTSPGAYQLRCTLTDGLGDSVTSDVSITVAQTAVSLRLSPTAPQVRRGKKIALSVSELDQFGVTITPGKSLRYKIQQGPGTINAKTGRYIAAKKKTGHVRIVATADGLTAKVLLTVVA